MSYHVDLTPEARREVKALSGHLRAQALDAFEMLANDPRPDRSRELRGKPGIYRVWLAGRWRIAYSIDDAAAVVTILRVRTTCAPSLLPRVAHPVPPASAAHTAA